MLEVQVHHCKPRLEEQPSMQVVVPSIKSFQTSRQGLSVQVSLQPTQVLPSLATVKTLVEQEP